MASWWRQARNSLETTPSSTRVSLGCRYFRKEVEITEFEFSFMWYSFKNKFQLFRDLSNYLTQTVNYQKEGLYKNSNKKSGETREIDACVHKQKTMSNQKTTHIQKSNSKPSHI